MNNFKKVAIHGLGYLGYTTLSSLVDNYFDCYVCDYKKNRRSSSDSLNLLNEFFDNLYLSENNGRPKKSLITFCTQSEIYELKDIDFHIISVSTENEGIPEIAKLESILSHLKKIDKRLHIVIESTLYPGIIENTILPIMASKGMQIDKDYLLSFIVRQDFMKNIDDLKKDNTYIISGISQISIDEVKLLYNSLGKSTVETSEYKSLEIIKHIENSLEHIHQSFANQLALSFSNYNYNIDELFETIYKHNGIKLSSSLGSNGFAVPVSSRILIDSISNPNSLSILKESILVDMSMITVIKDDLVRNNVSKILVLGVSSEGDIRQHIFSTFLRLVDYLVDSGMDIYIYDPYFNVDELKSLSKAEVLGNFEESKSIEGVIVGSNHSWMKFLNMELFIENFKNCKYFLDNGSFLTIKNELSGYKSISEINDSKGK